LLQSHPPNLFGLNDSSSYLVFASCLDYHDVQPYIDGELVEGNTTVDTSCVEFRDALGRIKCILPLGIAYEEDGDGVEYPVVHRIIHSQGDWYVLSGVKYTDLMDMSFPVVVDPSMNLYSGSDDGYLWKATSSYYSSYISSTGSVSSSGSYMRIGQKYKTWDIYPPYQIYRAGLFFNTSMLPDNIIVTNATLSLYNYHDSSSTDFDITVQNGQPTYPHQPLESGDYQYSHYSGNGGILNTSSFTGGYNNITLTNLSWLNQSGWTKLCFDF
jgi:hypothetical protein